MAAHAAFLRDEVLLHSEATPALGLSLHLADIALPELRAACEEGGAAEPVPWPALKVCMPLLARSVVCLLQMLLACLPSAACAFIKASSGQYSLLAWTRVSLLKPLSARPS